MAQGRLSVTVSCCDAERSQQGCRCMEITAASTAGFDWGRSSTYMYPYGSMCNVTEKTMLQFYEVPQPMQLVPSTTMNCLYQSMTIRGDLR